MKINSTVIFIHIPKTAGRTLESILEKQYSKQSIYNIYGYGNSIKNNVEVLKNLSNQQKHNIKLIKSHYQFGLHQFLPQSTVYLTFLRNPIKRILSHYAYVSKDKYHPLYNIIHEQKMGVKEYVSSGISIELNNGQTRLISGQEHDYKFGQTPKHLLDKAIENIEKNSIFVGLVENFNKSLILMKYTLNYGDIRYVSRNVAKQKKSISPISQDTIEIIQKYNELDIQLYNYAQQRLNQLIDQNQTLLEHELPKFRYQNQQYQLWGRLNLFTQSATRKLKSLLR